LQGPAESWKQCCGRLPPLRREWPRWFVIRIRFLAEPAQQGGFSGGEKRWISLGIAVLRFNFAGAGLSEGVHDKGQARSRCARGAGISGDSVPTVRLLVAGFSFGCWVGMRAGCEDAASGKVIAIGAPVNNSDFSFLGKCAKPKLFVHGSMTSTAMWKKCDSWSVAAGKNELVLWSK